MLTQIKNITLTLASIAIVKTKIRFGLTGPTGYAYEDPLHQFYDHMVDDLMPDDELKVEDAQHAYGYPELLNTLKGELELQWDTLKYKLTGKDEDHRDGGMMEDIKSNLFALSIAAGVAGMAVMDLVQYFSLTGNLVALRAYLGV
ncbi:hypothetical protein [Paraburkholderia fungorum]|jgi:hypothetical protein|uniref:hypothetical protein n=1 Tax=Paraburkholderia fungorum TaxID=134537 RepID=UPI000D079BB5|nr:hypothetical protein [Paraburkholderia fungorum]PRZ42900.1 hypothetical protein BX589_15416 [Paraburkholderia fungorum]